MLYLRYFYLVVFLAAFFLQLPAQKNKREFSPEVLTGDTMLFKNPTKIAKEAVNKAIEEYKQKYAEGFKNATVRKLRNQCEDALKLAEKTGDKNLQLQILPYLKSLAEWKNDKKEAEDYSQKMQLLQATMTAKSVEIPTGNYKPIPTEPIKTPETKVIAPASSPTVVYVETPKSPEKAPSPKAVAAEKAKQEKEKMLMMDILKEHKEAVQGMNEAQAKNALLELQQRSMTDSFNYIKITDSLAIITKDWELNENKAELKVEESQKKFSWALAGLVAIIAIAVFFRFRKEQKYSNILGEKNALIAKEKERSEELLLNILPATVAEELKLKGIATARYYQNVTVLFTDFKDFTKIASQLSPEELVADLDYCFKKFDSIVLKYSLEKIKTIGDSYMVASGIPETSPDHALRMMRAAKEMVAFINEWKTQKIMEKKPYFEARIGAHTGPVVAGVVGSKKFAYDIWGDTVNVASRMESSGEVGKINISAATYELIKIEFACTYRGKVAAKNKGEIDMYFVG